MHKYIFVVGGVISGVGKGAATGSIGLVLQSKGYKVTAVKIDPYVNIDAGTMNPIEHGEVFVTDDGDETDQDIGNYERLLGADILSCNYMTTGRVYQSVIEKERKLEYGGKCVEVVPHIPEEVIRRIELAATKTKAEITLIEVGGTIGEYQNVLFLEAGRIMKYKHPKDVLFVLVSYLPIPKMLGEMKTKPTQHAISTMNAAGIRPDFVIGRAEVELDNMRKQKISFLCNIELQDVISAPDVTSVYEIPLDYSREGLGDRILQKFNLSKRGENLQQWKKMVGSIKSCEKDVKIVVLGKYFTSGSFSLSDSYISVIEAIKHAAWFNKYNPKITWLDSEEYEKQPLKVKELLQFDGLIVPGGFGTRGIEGKIAAIKYARENKIPYLGLCYGMQLAVVEFARNVCQMKNAHTTEINPTTNYPVIHTMNDQVDKIAIKKYGGSMRLGSYPALLQPDTISYKAYKASKWFKVSKQAVINERHRHRYEFNNLFRDVLIKNGLIVAATSLDGVLVEVIELKDHPFFVGVQFHPEFKSRPLDPHPLFIEFIKVAMSKS